MRRLPLAMLLMMVLACNTLMPTLTPTPAPSAFTVSLPSATPTLSLASIATPLSTPTIHPTAPVAPTVSAATAAAGASDLYIAAGDVRLHPDPELHSGDFVSLEVIVHDGANRGLKDFPVAVYVGDEKLDVERAEPTGLSGRLQATFTWVWNTTGLEGVQQLKVAVDPNDEVKLGDENPDNNTLEVSVTLLPAAPQPNWQRAESACCIFNYLSGTAAARDIELIKATADEAMTYVEHKLGRQQNGEIIFNLIDRLLGHGGFASDVITITYIDRDYAGGDLQTVFRHEATHVLDRQGGGPRPMLITEGLAVYVTGGHFKLEPLEPRAVDLLALNRYIPLAELADSFYTSQHEIGYLESGAFIQYLVDTYGWERFAKMLGAFQEVQPESAMLDGGLRVVYSKTLAGMEAEWLAHLSAQVVDPRWQRDVADTVAYYDTVRRYQQLFDPSAYFLTAWTPDIKKAVRENITADYSRHPEAPEDIALETLLVEAERALAAGEFDSAERDLDAINAVLTADGDFTVDPLAADYLALTRSAVAAGYAPQRIRITADAATITAALPGQPAALAELTVTRVNGLWQMN